MFSGNTNITREPRLLCVLVVEKGSEWWRLTIFSPGSVLLGSVLLFLGFLTVKL